MKQFFHLDKEVDEAVHALEQKMGNDYSDRSERSVFTMCSMTYSNKNVSYRNGCEFIRYTAQILGEEYDQKYLGYGRPCQIEIRTPLGWLKENTDERTFPNLIRSLFAHWLLNSAGELDHLDKGMDSAVIFRSEIPSEMIYHFHY